MKLKLGCYQLIVECYNYKKFCARLMITLKRNPTVDTKMIKRKQSKHLTTKNKHTLHQITKEESKREREEQKIEKLTEHSEQNVNSKFFPINNYFRWKSLKLIKQKT